MTVFPNDHSVTPLEEIERRAQDRAKRLTGGVDVAPDELRSIVVDEVERWNLDFQRGLRAVEVTDPVGVVDRALRNLSSYGPLTPLLRDDDVWEIAINAPDAIFVKRHDGPSGFHDEVFHDDEHVLRTLTRLLDDAPGAHRKLDPAEGLQDARLDDGSRVHIVHGDIGRAGHLLVNIRRFTGRADPVARRAGRHGHTRTSDRGVPPRVHAGPRVDRLRGRARRGEDNTPVLLPRGARSVTAHRGRRRGLRG